MKKQILLTVCAVAVACTTHSYAHESTNTDESNGFGFDVGYRSISLKKTTYSHDTHPDDWFLPNANVPGSAGSTSLDGKDLSYLSLGISCESEIYSPFYFNIGAGGLLGGGTRDDHQNANDPRPAVNAAFVYSKASTYGFYGDIGLSYKKKGFSVGIEGSITGIAIESGWDRYNTDQVAEKKWFISPVIGPTIGYQFTDWLQAKSALQFGEHSRQFFIELCIGAPTGN